MLHSLVILNEVKNLNACTWVFTDPSPLLRITDAGYFLHITKGEFYCLKL